MNERVYLVDGSGYIFRAYFAIRPLSTRTGIPTNAVLGVARMLGKLIKEEKPHYLAVVFDAPEDNFRHTIFADYKANRDTPPEDLAPQFALVHQLVDAMDIPVLMLPGYEADDVMATLSKQAVARGHDVVLVSGDKDLMQLVAPHVAMYDPMKEKHYQRDDVIEKFGVPPERVVDVLALAGDSSDNIPGVPKVGPKSAAKLVSEYGDVEAILRGLAAPGRAQKAFELSVLENAESARLSKRLASLADEAPVTLELDKVVYNAPRADKLAPFLRHIEAVGLLREFGFDREAEAPPESVATGTSATEKAPSDADELPDEVGEAASGASEGPSQAQETEPTAREPGVERPMLADLDAPRVDRSVYRCLFKLDEVRGLVARARDQRLLAFDLETTSLDPNQADIIGVALCVPGEPAVYVPVGHHYLGVPKQLSRAELIEALRGVLEDPRVAKMGQHLKYDMVALARAGVAVAGISEDAMLAAYVLDPSRAGYSLDTLAREVLGHDTIRYADVIGTGKNQIPFYEVSIERATEYAAENADVALRLCRALRPKVEAAGMAKLYRELEIPLVPVLARMERIGIKVDPTRLRELGAEFTTRLALIERRAQELIGEPVNLASPKQIAELLFVKLGLASGRKTKTGFSTDSDVLEGLAKDHELPRVILEHRMLSKLKSTYIDMLPRMINRETGRVHTSYNQTGAATGRLSSSDPNLQNIPARGDDGRRIRAAFVPEPGWVLISADYSQIELRVMAHLSHDERFLEAFKRGEDIHTRTAQEILTGGVPPDAEMRRRAKAINFGILYGLSEFGLSRQLDIHRAEAAVYIKAYFARYPRIRGFLDQTIEDARRRGYVTTMLGRRRYIPDINSKNKNARQAAERVAMNSPIQGTAADIIKLAMLRVDVLLRERQLRSRLLLQVHDELVVEAPEAEREATMQLLREAMSSVMSLAVPLDVEVGAAMDWASAH
jgi:DNA polymerase I